MGKIPKALRGCSRALEEYERAYAEAITTENKNKIDEARLLTNTY